MKRPPSGSARDNQQKQHRFRLQENEPRHGSFHRKIIKINQTQNPIRSFSRFFPVCGNSISSAIIVATSSLVIESKSIANSLVACAVFAFSITFLTYLPLPKSCSFLAASNKRNSFSQASSVSVRPLRPAIVFAISQRASVS